MYPTDTANISDGTSNHVYSLVTLGNDKIESVRRESAAPIDQPALLTIKHQESGSGLDAKVSSLLRFDRVVEDASGNQGTIECYLVTRYPSKIATTTQVGKTMSELVSFLAVAGYKDKFLAQEP